MSRKTVDIREARRRLSELVDKAVSGQDVVVSRHGKPLVRIPRLVPAKRRLAFGLLKGKVAVSADFDAPLPNEVLDGFEGP